MTRRAAIGLAAIVAAAAGSLIAFAVVPILMHGISARDRPTRMEELIARRMRHYAIPRSAKGMANPVPLSSEVTARALAHFADHCATCHGNDGRGGTTIGRNLYPKAPDMTLPATQSLSDGELFAIIENGVRLTGMPAWGTPNLDDKVESWELVHFIRHLSKLSAAELDEMKGLNPRSHAEWEEEDSEKKFLEGGGEAPAPPSHHHPAR
jgi:mono/diheme cytochrome c family protein